MLLNTLKVRSNKFLLLILFFLFQNNFARTYYVYERDGINHLQKVIQLAYDKDTIKIFSGIYFVNDLVIKKPLTIIGVNNPTFDGNNKNSILRIKSNNVLIEGIHFKNAGISFVNDNYAIKLDSVSNCTIKNNKFSNNFFAIYIAKSFNCRIIGNKISGNQSRQTYAGNGIHLWYSKNIIVIDNSINGHRDGIYMEFVRRCNFSNNHSFSNLRYGMHFMFSDSCEYSNNIFEKNKSGVAVMYSHFVSMYENTFKDNWGDASYGLLLKEISDGIIKNNYFIKNSCGIFLEGSNRNKINGNDFKNNGWAVRLMANSMDNVFSKNNFIGNSFEVTTNHSRNFNTFINNYWSDYQGYDLNKDGIGDIPHHPVKLFSFLVEKNRTLLILLRSFFIELLNSAEKIFPILTPETLTDNQPSMRVLK